MHQAPAAAGGQIAHRPEGSRRTQQGGLREEAATGNSKGICRIACPGESEKLLLQYNRRRGPETRGASGNSGGPQSRAEGRRAFALKTRAGALAFQNRHGNRRTDGCRFLIIFSIMALDFGQWTEST